MARRTLAVLTAWFIVACAPAAPRRSSVFTSDRISVTTSGAGPDVVLIPGLASSPQDVWGGTVAAVPGYRYHLVQVAGFAGLPSGANGSSGPVVQPVADEIVRYMKERGLRRPAMVGLSMGGSLAMLIAARHPDALSKLMVVDMVPSMGVFFGPPGVTTEGLRPVAERVQSEMSASPDAWRRSVEHSVSTMIRTESERARAVSAGLASDRAVAGRAMYDLILQDLRGEMSGVTVPVTVLYVHGPHVPISVDATDAVYREAFANTPKVTLKRIPNAYHFIMLDEPQRFAEELRIFLR
ncbi:MAG: alpha/beta hydrolase [Gemmatimonadota bacterium]